MTSKTKLAIRAVKEATRLRARLGIGPTESVCPLDIAIGLGIIVRLEALPSLEGVYSPGSRDAMVISTNRPWGRIRHTCGHELGHHVFRHGANVDEFDQSEQRKWKPEEFVADRFSTALLMPKLAVAAALNQRSWSSTNLSPEQAFVLAQGFGVGYTNFISHLERTLGMIDRQTADRLRGSRGSLRRLRDTVAGFETLHDVFVGDEHWGARPIDIETGDVVVIPPGAMFSGRCAQLKGDPLPHLVGVAAGQGQLKLRTQSRAIRIRVCRKGFTGLAKYRHLEEADGE
ncbi:MAG: ImmA/IrrE family metallo-endopeptidase [Gammaproteobacteria bacterium]|nr:ImmA/IrrE family metallo-endopeptidase [Gammaproteobacteria bacterium]MDE0270539.1 ImmA/IrrE family metallo-endopeptidase [Gammaproteobacteria bacterium]